MSKVIIDSSTINSFSRFIGRYDPQRLELNAYGSDAYEIFENVIEAFLLYDNICFDKETFDCCWFPGDFNVLELPFCSTVSTKSNALNEYSQILSTLNIPSNKIRDIAWRVENDWESFIDSHGNAWVQNLRPQDLFYNKLCTNFINKYKNEVQMSSEDVANIVFYGVIRFLYYEKLGSTHNASLVIHPNRGIIALALSEHRRLFNSSKIFKNFEKVGEAQQYRFNQYIPINYNTIKLPLVSNFVSKLVDWNNPNTFLDTIIKVRNMPEIKDFRQGLGELTSLLLRTDKDATSELSHIFNDLDCAIESWSKNLDKHPNTRNRIATIGSTSFTVNASLGVVGYSVGYSQNEETIIVENDNHPITSKMLTFIHTTICNSIQR